MALFGFGKKNSNKENSCCCGGNGVSEAMQQAEQPAKSAGVKILGGGCAKCNQLEQATIEALSELGMETTVEHVRDFETIATYGVMTTPALVVDEKVVSCGKVLKKEEIIELLRKERE